MPAGARGAEDVNATYQPLVPDSPTKLNPKTAAHTHPSPAQVHDGQQVDEQTQERPLEKLKRALSTIHPLREAPQAEHLLDEQLLVVVEVVLCEPLVALEVLVGVVAVVATKLYSSTSYEL